MSAGRTRSATLRSRGRVGENWLRASVVARSFVVANACATFGVFQDGVGAKREQMTCWVLPRGDPEGDLPPEVAGGAWRTRRPAVMTAPCCPLLSRAVAALGQ